MRKKSMLLVLVVGFLLVLLSASPALAAQKAHIYSAGRWEDGQKAAHTSALVIVGRVVEAGKIEGKGWDGNQSRVGADAWIGKVEIDQTVTVAVTEVLRGSPGGKQLRVRLGALYVDWRSLVTHFNAYYRKCGRATVGMKLPPKEFALRKGKTYLFFLKPPVRPKAGEEEKKSPIASHRELISPAEAKSSAELINSVRAFFRALDAWYNPPELEAEEAARIKALIRQLGDERYDKRQEANTALRSAAHRIAPYLKAAAMDADIERATAARKIIGDLSPRPGQEKLPRASAFIGARRRVLPRPAGRSPAPPAERKTEAKKKK